MKFSAITDKVVGDCANAQDSYGVVASDGTIMHDITTERTHIMRLVELLNKYDVEPLHLCEVVDDFLFEITTVIIKRKD